MFSTHTHSYLVLAFGCVISMAFVHAGVGLASGLTLTWNDWRTPSMFGTYMAPLPLWGWTSPEVSFTVELSPEKIFGFSGFSFVGKYASIRAKLDYAYHSQYSPSRQLLQDSIIDSMLNNTWIKDEDGSVCETSADPWIVFMGGAMGAGKSFTLRQMAEKKRFPLKSFVAVDPDDIRHHIPEFHRYVEEQPERAGELTRDEAGIIAEILTQAALQKGRNVLVDGSLRNATWYQQYFGELREENPHLRIGILHVTAPREAVLQRAADRAKITGRVVPHETLEQALKQVPRSIKVLAPLADFFCELHNPPGAPEVQLNTEGLSWSNFQNVWNQNCKPRDRRKRAS